VKSSTISAACSVVDVLGADIRTAFIDRYVGLELKDYRRIFRVTDTNEAGALDNVSRRFAWFRRLLQTYEVEAGRVFPLEWRVGWSLFAKFIDITRHVCIGEFDPKVADRKGREDMSVLLDKAKTQLTVPLLLDTLQQTMEFESSIATKFGVPVSALIGRRISPCLTVIDSYPRSSGRPRPRTQPLDLPPPSPLPLRRTWVSTSTLRTSTR
jgi:hypothetical protein